jgi:hypothetical protein
VLENDKVLGVLETSVVDLFYLLRVCATGKDTGHAVLFPAAFFLLLLGHGHVQDVHRFLVCHAILQEKLHQGQHLCTQARETIK